MPYKSTTLDKNHPAIYHQKNSNNCSKISPVSWTAPNERNELDDVALNSKTRFSRFFHTRMLLMRSSFLFLVAACFLHQAVAVIYVAPDGLDSNSGTRGEPLASLTHARDVVRKAQNDRRIVLRGGTYDNVTLELDARDSGLVIEAEPGETPVLTGGVPLSGWKKEGDTFFSASLPPGNETAEVRLLEVDGKWAPRARYPATGTLMHETTFDVRWMSSTAGGWQRKPTQEELTTLRYKTGDLPEGLKLRNAEITVYHMWDESCVGLAAHDPAERRLTFSSPAGHPPGAFDVKKYVLWNLREGLTTPGQWYHDRERGRIIYWPLPGQDLSDLRVVAATRTCILRVRGTQQDRVKNLTLRGLTASATTVPLLAAGFASADYDGAVSLENTESCTLDHLRIVRVAGHGINTRGVCQSLHVIDCEVAECGAGGIYAGGNETVIENNLVHDIGLAYPSAIGIYRGGKNNIVRHNEVHNTSYSAINYGGENNRIESNLIYHCMKVLHDGAAIYLFEAKNCVIRGNVARDITDLGGYGASAIYLDEQSTGCVVESNLTLRVPWVFQNHMARKNVLRNNVAIVVGDAKIAFSRCHDFTFEGNVIDATGRIVISNPDAVTVWKNNVFHSGNGKIEQNILEPDTYKIKSVIPGAPKGSSTEDPLFVDAKNGDYHYRPGSPASALGLQALDVAEAGRRGKKKAAP